MSRSYGKVHSETNRGERKTNKRYRAQNRMCIRKEMISPEYDDVVFPSYKTFTTIYRWKNYLLKDEIREDVNLEIKQTLNGESKPKFEWFKGRRVRKAFRAWPRKPFDAFRNLSRRQRSLIEKAVSSLFKVKMAK